MGTADNLKNIINHQKAVLSKLEAEYQAVESNDLTKENTWLKAELGKLRTDFQQAKNSASILTNENAGLKNALHEQIYNEKLNLINTSTKKLDIYFHTTIEGEINKLTSFEHNVKSRINNIKKTLIQNNIAAQNDIYPRLNELSAMLNSRITEIRAKAAQVSGIFSQEERNELEALKNERITDDQIRTIAKKNNMERFIGLNVLNTVGVFLLIIGAITLSKFVQARLSDLSKGVILFMFGGVMLAAGEILNRKKPTIFSLGISAGGIGILYVALAVSYFRLHILGMYPAILVCVLITAAAFVLSNRHNSQTIAAFALIGGYLPIFSIGSNTVVAYGAMVYFITLNLLALLISFNRKWSISSFIGLFLNIVGTFYISSISSGTDDILKKAFTILYLFFAFLIYTLIPIVSTYRTRLKFTKSDIVLMAINTLFSSLIIYWTFYDYNLQDYDGLLAVIFAVIYLFLGKFIENNFSKEEYPTRALFYLTGFSFVILVIPLQLGRIWLSLGWLAEGVLLASYGILNDEKKFEQAGFIISLLCLGAFILFDCTHMKHYLFVYKYFAITLGSLVILGSYMYRKTMAGQFIENYKYFALGNVWLFSMYLILVKLWDALYTAYGKQTVYQIDYLLGAAAVSITFSLAYAFPRIKLLSDAGTKILSIVLYAIGILALSAMNMTLTPVTRTYLQTGTPALGITIVGTAIIVVLGILSLLALHEITKILLMKRAIGIEWHPLVISGYFVIILTQNLVTQFNLSFSSAIISIIYALAALAWIIFGFTRRYSFIRKFGLGLAILSVIKLSLVDLASLTQEFKIVSYFLLGITLIAISFVYQYFNKRMELH